MTPPPRTCGATRPRSGRPRWLGAWPVLALLASVTLVTVTPTPAEAVTPRARTTGEARVELQLLDAHNRLRTDPQQAASAGLPLRDPYRWADDLAQVARAWSDEQARRGQLAHNPQRSAQVCCSAVLAEQVGVRSIAVSAGGEVTHEAARQAAEQLLRTWLASGSHRANLVDDRFTQVGIGVSVAHSGRVYATVLLRAPNRLAPAGTAAYQAPRVTDPGAGCIAPPVPLVGDWNASGTDGLGWWCDGRIRLRDEDGSVRGYTYGRIGDVPIAADLNGDGRDTVSIVRDGVWHRNDRLAGGDAAVTFVFGRVSRGDVPITGAWLRGGVDLPGVVRDGTWHLRFSQTAGPADRSFVYGRLTAGDLPLVGDFNGDGRDTVGIVRQGTWHLRNSHRGGTADLRYVYGRVLAGDVPVMGDFNGDGRDTPGIVRGTRWHLRDTHGGGPADRVVTFAPG